MFPYRWKTVFADNAIMGKKKGACWTRKKPWWRP
jgi:hypothetical protein